MRIPRVLAATSVCALLTACQAPAASSPSGADSRPSETASGAPARIHNPGKVTYSLVLQSGQCHARGSGPASYLPDPSCTPGGVDPEVTQATIGKTICRPGGYTDTVRPPVAQTDKAKRTQYTAYGIRKGTKSELDHLVPLSLGGDNDITNLWPEIGPIPNPKDAVENDLRRAVCSGRVKLADAQQAIAVDWTTAERKLGL